MNHGQAVFFVFVAVYVAIQLTIAGVNLAGIRDGLAGIRDELARLRKMVP